MRLALPCSLGLLCSLALFALSCTPEKEFADVRVPLTISRIQTVKPAVEGSPINVILSGVLLAEVANPVLFVSAGGQKVALEANTDDDQKSEFVFLATDELIRELGNGDHDTRAYVKVGDRTSLDVPFSISVAEQIPFHVDTVPSDVFHWNDKLIFTGDGFLHRFEGSVQANIVGEMTFSDNHTAQVDETVIIVASSTVSRERGVLELHPSIGQGTVGTLRADVTFESELLNGEIQSSGPLKLQIQIAPPEIFEFGENSTGTFEELMPIYGAGFIDPSDPEGSTKVVLSGVFTDERKKEKEFDEIELFPTFENGQLMRWRIDSKIDETKRERISGFFETDKGNFSGTVQVTTQYGSAQPVTGPETSIDFRLVGMRQVALVRFSGNFLETLRLFGLSGVSETIQDKIVERMRGIFTGYRVEFHDTMPDDVHPNGLTIIDLEGDDPNGLGYFGLDATPGKDQGNLRMNDQVGGANAESLEDGGAGYGGVFINNYLAAFSHHPSPMKASPQARPSDLFDEVFDPVRESPALPSELTGTSTRAKAVQRAINAFSAMVGETAAHEFGHSLGLANPQVSGKPYHNTSDGKGCLMDDGGRRKMEERFDEAKGVTTKLCGRNRTEIDDLLGD